MSLALRAWFSGAGRRLRRRPTVDLWENRRRLIRQLAPGKSFIDVGGMWNVYGEVSFLAEEEGATSVVLMDGMDPVDEFQRKHGERSSHVRYVQGDLHDAEVVRQLGSFDVVWCAGILYHSPNPSLLLEHLRQLTAPGGVLLVGTHFVPEVPGFEGACLFYPAFSPGARAEFARAHGDQDGLYVGASTPFDRTPAMGYVNFWWGFSPSALRAMLEVSGFAVVEEFRTSWWFTDVVARRTEAPSVIPPPAFARERGEARRVEFDKGSAPAWSQRA